MLREERDKNLKLRGDSPSEQLAQLNPQSSDPWLDPDVLPRSQKVLAAMVVPSAALRGAVRVASRDSRVWMTGVFFLLLATFGYLLLAVPHADIDGKKMS